MKRGATAPSGLMVDSSDGSHTGKDGSNTERLNAFVSKARTLQLLSGLLKSSLIEQSHVFSERDWQSRARDVVDAIRTKFQGQTIVVRSSAAEEDGLGSSNAGAFRSVLHVDSGEERSIHRAVETVLASYREKGTADPDNLVLVQRQTKDVVSSGIVLTRDFNGAPYYVINYWDGPDTAAVTSGRRSSFIRILRSGEMTIPARFASLVAAVGEIEALTPSDIPLDIEYGIKASGQIVIFQVRPLVAVRTAPFPDSGVLARVRRLQTDFAGYARQRAHLAGPTTYFGDMPDWNPAEIIGSSPRPLAVSLYDHIITDSVWHRARTSQGYTDVSPAKLVVTFGNKPYVDVRSTFNSFVPAGVPRALREKLMAFYLTKLRERPELQDKVEFEVLYTCYDLSFDARARELLDAGFHPPEVVALKTCLLDLTNRLLKGGSIRADLESNRELEEYRQSLPELPADAEPSQEMQRCLRLLDACREKGTLQFSRLARLAFIAKALLKSLVAQGAIESGDYDAFLESINSVASEFTRDIDLLSKGRLDKSDFLRRYGHLRPGTYDITVPRYDMSDNYFGVPGRYANNNGSGRLERFHLPAAREDGISAALSSRGLEVTAGELFDFARAALEAREHSKFLFSRALSDAMECIARAGMRLGFSRDDLSYLDMGAIRAVHGRDADWARQIWSEAIARSRSDYVLSSLISLPPIIFTEQDFEVVAPYESRPNYITNKEIEGSLVFVTGDASQEVAGRVVVLEAADPGFDWLFAKKPAALITKYGGPASHMAVRCAELGLPAIIGAGDLLFESLLHADSVALDCENETIELTGARD